MIITTAGRTNKEMVIRAKQIGIELGLTYVHRNKRSVQAIMEIEQADCIVVSKNRMELYPYGETEPFFFHPNSSMFRVKRLKKGESDPFVEAAQLELGMSVLDCTLGLASDSIVASYSVGFTGKIIGIEANPFLAFIVQQGLQSWQSGMDEMDEAMRNISVIQGHSLEVMRTLADDSVDCVYFDPMFEESILESDGIRNLTKFARIEGISDNMISEALRIARKRIILKDHYRSPRFAQFNFKVYKRKSAKFHFGVIEKT
ncbi:class I SAM-dependent methyltransferase [Bacillus sp. B15-48]|uniref:class I SAM-dependent methyltransferase n=1 Tax=Bacillus sp. B15-48 TaxID=1548601 RepID=UPI00193ECF81|nr:class I SAM-dependent methyltransferase [Bacillus sp. B15-48]MBM4762044.1 hypothetical protein [Bacillus sp. B15-48]